MIKITKNCPICSRKMDKKNHPFDDIIEYVCTNNCFYFYNDNRFYTISSFDEKVVLGVLTSEEHYVKAEEAIIKSITYWRQNDRYLMKILAG